MTTVLAAVDDSAAAGPVLATAVALGPTLGATARAIQVADTPGLTAQAAAAQLGVELDVVPGDPVEQIVAAAAADDVVAVVVGTRDRPGGRRPAGHLALALADRVDKPVVMVPPDASPPERIRRVLVAMEGTPGRALRGPSTSPPTPAWSW